MSFNIFKKAERKIRLVHGLDVTQELSIPDCGFPEPIINKDKRVVKNNTHMGDTIEFRNPFIKLDS